jgi:hypothetical protein
VFLSPSSIVFLTLQELCDISLTVWPYIGAGWNRSLIIRGLCRKFPVQVLLVSVSILRYRFEKNGRTFRAQERIGVPYLFKNQIHASMDNAAIARYPTLLEKIEEWMELKKSMSKGKLSEPNFNWWVYGYRCSAASRLK